MSPLHPSRALIAGVLALLSGSAPLVAQSEPPELDWIVGPAEGRLGTRATIDVPEGYAFLERSDTIRLLELMQNPTSGQELGTLTPAEEDGGGWFLFFEFDDIGYVKDDDRDELDADELYESLDEGNEQANEERRRRGWPEYHLTAWETPPAYNEATRNLEWGTRGVAEGQENVNHNIRVLGRRGVMMVTLVGGVEVCRTALPEVQQLLTGFQYNSGQQYGDVQQGDKIAEYGLVALVTGGAAAVALKTGLFKKFGKLILLALAGLAGLLKKLFGRKDG